ncbi:amidohydrolase family protein [Leifsonia shinshuensis]|uniref:Cytosine/adenosine deaminase-related metal-dependent hydrolase n=1 Tax=Leifsonia shinshuensis TaxID=150026 RepID=A0A853CY06_9MICO|nr:cytosine/adenosine deaminase-related metal-dependent hydrolase [Leifsonia shinshuensis]
MRDVTVLSMDPEIGDLPRADIAIVDGTIVDVTASAGEGSYDLVIDGDGMIALPGFVDTHWHLWNSLLRGVVSDAPGRDYFAVKRALAPVYTSQDFYWAARFGLAEAIAAGITSVHNWDHNVQSPEDADLNIRAQLDAGIRGRFSYGPRDSTASDHPMDLEDLPRLLERWPESRTRGLIHFGVALRGLYRTPRVVWQAEWDTARSLNLPITMHCDRCLREDNCRNCGLGLLAENGLLGSDVQIVHAVHASPADIQAVARTGTRISLSPITELRTMGFPLLTEFLEAGVSVSLSTDTLAMPTSPDVLGTLRALEAVELARTGRSVVTPRGLLAMATIEGARDLGLSHETGSITPGKRADLVLIRRDSNLQPPGDPYEDLVRQGRGENIDTVIADGRLLKREGKLTRPSDRQAVDDAARYTADLLERARSHGHWPPPGALATPEPTERKP